jgi:hypothetical protein
MRYEPVAPDARKGEFKTEGSIAILRAPFAWVDLELL